MNNDCIFCRIINGEQKPIIIFEDKSFIAFFDHRPLFHGHTLLMPKKHIETLEDLPKNLMEPLFFHLQQISTAVQAGTKAEGTFIAINNKVSQSVPHLHIHIIPRNKGDGLRGFFWPRQQYEDENQIVQLQKEIKKYISM